MIILIKLFDNVPIGVTAIQNDTAARDGGSSDYLAERRLRHVLMGHDDYYVRERPVNISSDPVQVYIKMVMYGLISLVSLFPCDAPPGQVYTNAMV